MRRLVLLLTALALVIGLAACSDDSGGAGDGTTTTNGAPAPGADGSEFEDVTALRDGLTDAGIDCDLDYEGLADEQREVSQCVIEGDQAVISIWYDASLRDEVVAAVEETPGATLATGANWTVEVASPDVAQTVAEALDGVVVGGDTTTTTAA